MKRLAGLLIVLGLALAQGTVYKLKVTNWSCALVGGEMVAKGQVVNQAGKPLRLVRVNLRVVDRTVTRVNGVATRREHGTNSALIPLRTLPDRAASSFVVRVRPTKTRNVSCQIWFRNPSVVQIPTRVPQLP